MGRPENYRIGREGEERIKAILYEHRWEIKETDKGNYPDFTFARGDKWTWGAECKTMRGVHSGGAVGMAKISREEYRGMLDLRQENLEPCLIVEVRPKGFKSKNYFYFYVPWSKVEKRFEKTNPQQLSLSLWWILKNGIDLRRWLDG